MTASLLASRPLDATLPPMPRRQSCDRCHEQKVRCVTEGLKGSLHLGGIGEESEASFGGHVVSAVPCVRCRKAGAICVYSPQLRSGRPRLQRDSSVPPLRKRVRRVSRCSSSSSLNSSLSPTLSQSLSPHSSSPSSTTPSFSNAIGLGIFESPSQPPPENVVSQLSPLPSPAATTPRCSAASQVVPELDAPLLTDQWLMSPFDSDGNQFLTGMSQLTSFSHATTGPTIPCVPLFADAPPEMPPAAEPVLGRYPCSYSNPPADNSLEELAQINMRIHVAGRALSTPTNALALMSSPAVDDIISAACSLISLVDRYAAKRAAASPRAAKNGQAAQPQRMVAPSTLRSFSSYSLAFSPIIDKALDSSVCLMIHSCHQALLGVFEDLSASLLAHLSELQHPTPPGTPPGSSAFPSCHEQVGVVVNLISHLLNQLDRAIGPLSTHINGPPQPARFSMTPRQEPAGHFEHHTHYQEHQPMTQGGVFSPLLSEMDQRQLRVRDQVKRVEGLLRQPNV